jgi:two-component system KDP operon response regulator KdpE
MGDKVTVLVIDDELEIRKLLAASMPDGYQTLEAETAKEGLRLTATNNPQLILLDLGLPDLDGVELTRQIREFSRIPIIVLSAREQEGDKVAALDAGANDYLTKPFGMGELHARMRAALRISKPTPLEGVIKFGNVRINLASREVFKEEKLVHLTPTEYQIILYLIQHSGRVVTHKQILSEIWGQAYLGQTQYLRVFMGQLRHKIEDNPARPNHLMTETGVGYRFRE